MHIEMYKMELPGPIIPLQEIAHPILSPQPDTSPQRMQPLSLMMLVDLAFNYETRHARLRTDFRERDVACSSWGIKSNVFDLLPEFRCGSAFDPMMAGSRFL